MQRLLHYLAAALVMALPATGLAQTEDEVAILETIDLMFEGLAARDTSTMASVLEPDARLIVTATQDGVPVFRAVPMPQFLGGIASDGPAIREEYTDPLIVVRDNLATAWVSYTFYVDGEISHCGEDAFQLVRTTSGWIIVAIADTRRRVGCG
jgi:hypothetical protein